MAVLAGDPRSVPSTMAAHAHPSLQFQEIQRPLLASMGTGGTLCTDIYASKMPPPPRT